MLHVIYSRLKPSRAIPATFKRNAVKNVFYRKYLSVIAHSYLYLYAVNK